jgi:hypothetical protein
MGSDLGFLRREGGHHVGICLLLVEVMTFCPFFRRAEGLVCVEVLVLGCQMVVWAGTPSIRNACSICMSDRGPLVLVVSMNRV